MNKEFYTPPQLAMLQFGGECLLTELSNWNNGDIEEDNLLETL